MKIKNKFWFKSGNDDQRSGAVFDQWTRIFDQSWQLFNSSNWREAWSTYLNRSNATCQRWLFYSEIISNGRWGQPFMRWGRSCYAFYPFILWQDKCLSYRWWSIALCRSFFPPFFNRSNNFVQPDHFKTTGTLRRIHIFSSFDPLIKACLHQHDVYRYADPLSDVVVNVGYVGNLKLLKCPYSLDRGSLLKGSTPR